jgi:hypothetical protein
VADVELYDFSLKNKMHWEAIDANALPEVSSQERVMIILQCTCAYIINISL